MTEDRRGQLAVELFDAYISLQRKEVKNAKVYCEEYARIIKKICPEKKLNQVTACNIFEHLATHKDPEATVIEILKQLKED
jgi:hypothetical protein